MEKQLDIKLTLKSDPSINDTILEYTGDISLYEAGRILEYIASRRSADKEEILI